MRPVVGQCASMGPRPGGHGKADCPPGKGLSISGGRKPERALRYPDSPPLKKVTVTPCHEPARRGGWEADPDRVDALLGAW